MSVPRLAIAALGAASPRVGALRYDPQRCSIGIVHLGVGNFHRAHQAVHVDAALANGQFDWAISGWSLRREAVPVALTPQDGIYS
ncbi:MAG: mannitol dehydrogenase family protein, partial [Proteobacteria bacterium]|nr:mannitol dehydrogenase family protein [Pseudomonadota bacterium]